MKIPTKTITIGSISFDVPHEYNTSVYHDLGILILDELRNNPPFREELIRELKKDLAPLILALE